MAAGKLRTALTRLASLTVTGVKHNYDIDAAPDKFVAAQLPVLIVVPTIEQGVRTQRYGEFVMSSPNGAKGLATYKISHLLLYAPIGAGKGPRSELPGLVDVVDSYTAAIRANPKLTGALFKPTSFQVFISPEDWGGASYYACRFWHELIVQVT